MKPHPCAHCGGDTLVHRGQNEEKIYHTMIECINRITCGIQLISSMATQEDADEDALKRWNRRTLEAYEVYTPEQYELASIPLRQYLKEAGLARWDPQDEEKTKIANVIRKDGLRQHEVWAFQLTDTSRIIAMWVLQDDGSEPYAVAEIKKITQVPNFSGYIVVKGVEFIYPSEYPDIPEILKMIRDF